MSPPTGGFWGGRPPDGRVGHDGGVPPRPQARGAACLEDTPWPSGKTWSSAAPSSPGPGPGGGHRHGHGHRDGGRSPDSSSARPRGDPLQRKMGEVSKVLSWSACGVCAVMFGVGMLQHRDILDMFLTAVAPGGGRHPRGAARHRHHRPGPGGGANGPAKRHHQAPARRGDPGLRLGDLLGQDGHPYQEPDDSAGGLDPVPGRPEPGPHPGDPLRGRQGRGPGAMGDPTETAIAQKAREEGAGKGPAGAGHAPPGRGPFDSVRKRMATCPPPPRRGDASLP